jgi:cytochrome c oxidase cbb3-type subunit III
VIDKFWIGGILALAAIGIGASQTPPAQSPGQATAPQTAAQSAPRTGGFVPGQVRQEEDPVQVAHGKTLYGVNCRACHGVDLRGGDMGGPSLLRSQVTLSDKKGELIVPIIHGSRQKMGMPAIGINDADAQAVAAYVRSVISTIGVQGTPPSQEREALNILVGDAQAGKAYFDAKCSSCHSATGDLAKIGSTVTDPKALQTRWVGAGRRSNRRSSGSAAPPATVSVTLPSGKVEGALVHIDNFLVTVKLPDGSVQSYRRDGDVPAVEVHDPLQAHRDLLAEYTDKDIHNVTAYLVTLK